MVNFQKNIYFCFIVYAKDFVWITINWEILKECQTTLPVSRGTCTWDKKQQLELDMEQCTGSKLGKEYVAYMYSF